MGIAPYTFAMTDLPRTSAESKLRFLHRSCHRVRLRRWGSIYVCGLHWGDFSYKDFSADTAEQAVEFAYRARMGFDG